MGLWTADAVAGGTDRGFSVVRDVVYSAAAGRAATERADAKCPRSSVRWEMLRDGIEEAEKIRLLRASGADMSGVEAALAPLRADNLHDRPSGIYAREVESVRAAVEAASRRN